MKLSLIIAAITAIAASAAFADDLSLQNRLAIERARHAQATATIGVYACQHGACPAKAEAPRTEARFTTRSNAHGQTSGAYTPANH